MAERMAALVARRHTARINFQQRRWASQGVLERLKSLIGIESDSKTGISSDIELPKGFYAHTDVPLRMKTITSRVFSSGQGEDWVEFPTPDLGSKFKMLKECHREFGSVPPNNVLAGLESVKDFVTYYENLQRPGIIPEMWKLENDDLPTNLSFQTTLPYKIVKVSRKQKSYH